MNNQATCLICRLNICQSILKSFKTLRSLTVRMSEQIILLNEFICKILEFGLRASVTPLTLWAPVTLVTVQTVSIQSADLDRLGLMLWSMGQTELYIVLMSLILHGEIVFNLSPSVTLTQVNFLQLRGSDIIALEVVLALTTLSLRDVIVVPPLIREGRRRRRHIRKGSSFPLLVLLLAALSLLPLENEKEKTALTTLSLRDVIVVPPLIREGRRRRSHIRRGSSFPLLILLLAALPLFPLENEKENGTSLKEEEETL